MNNEMITSSLIIKEGCDTQLLTVLVKNSGEKSYLNEKSFESIIDEKNEERFLITSKSYKDKLAKGIAWEVEDENIILSFCNISNDEESSWKLISEYTLSKEDIKAYMPIYEYNKNIMNNLNTVEKVDPYKQKFKPTIERE